MSVTILLVGLVVFAFFAGHLINKYASRYISLSGAEYLLIGVLVGPQLPPRLLTADSLEILAPLVSLLLGLSGFLVGIQATRQLARSKFNAVGFAIGAASIAGMTLILTTALTTLIGPVGTPLLDRVLLEAGDFEIDVFATKEQLQLALVLAAAASVTVSERLTGWGVRARSPAQRLLRACSLQGQLLAIIVVGVVLSFSHEPVSMQGFEIRDGVWLLVSLSLGLVFGLLFTLFIGHEQSTNRIFLATVGTVTCCSGVGAALGLSAMFLNLVSGVTVALISTHRATLHQELARLQQPIFVLFLLLTGALWAPLTEATAWLIPPIYIALRWLMRRFVPRIFTRDTISIDPQRIGNGLMGQGTLAVAVAVDYALQREDQASLVMTTVIVGVLAFDLFSGGALRRLLLDAAIECGNATSHLMPEPEEESEPQQLPTTEPHGGST